MIKPLYQIWHHIPTTKLIHTPSKKKTWTLHKKKIAFHILPHKKKNKFLPIHQHKFVLLSNCRLVSRRAKVNTPPNISYGADCDMITPQHRTQQHITTNKHKISRSKHETHIFFFKKEKHHTDSYKRNKISTNSPPNTCYFSIQKRNPQSRTPQIRETIPSNNKTKKELRIAVTKQT